MEHHRHADALVKFFMHRYPSLVAGGAGLPASGIRLHVHARCAVLCEQWPICEGIGTGLGGALQFHVFCYTGDGGIVGYHYDPLVRNSNPQVIDLETRDASGAVVPAAHPTEDSPKRSRPASDDAPSAAETGSTSAKQQLLKRPKKKDASGQGLGKRKVGAEQQNDTPECATGSKTARRAGDGDDSSMAAAAASSNVRRGTAIRTVASGSGAPRVVSGFGDERVDDVFNMRQRLDADEQVRARQRREEGTRGRARDFANRDLDRSAGGPWQAGRR